ncbi:MAG: monovalent cation/H+ antiporter complex subunit F [Defluviitaleaceae bacterium]|nr:monovalent cation/H+ antiporter complex subunit F [Defluviitaleaceae bacterium]
MIIFWPLFALLLTYIVRAIIGPTAWDRLLAMNLISTKIIVIIIVISSYRDLAFLLDFAIVYTLSGFICTIFLALFLFRVHPKRGDKK